MADYQQPIDRAGDLLKSSDLGRMPHVLAAWHAIDWNKSDDQNAPADAQVSVTNPGSISLFPALLKKPEKAQNTAILREFGISVYAQGSEKAKNRWELKLCLPDRDQIEAFVGKLNSDDFETYRSIVESFKTALDRLVALNLANALLANHVPRAQAREVNVYQWGSTAEYANLKRFHSIKPLVFAYTQRETAGCPGQALAEMLVSDMRNVRESSVAAALKKVIVELFRTCR